MSTAINAVFLDELTGEQVTRQLCKISEFFISSAEGQAAACQRWADERGNEQHQTILTFVSWSRAE